MQIEVIEKVSQLSVLLFSEGDRLSGEKSSWAGYCAPATV
jgi:hypothetical protein